MNPRTLSVIALSNRDFPSLEEKMMEAERWIELAVGQGAELVVLPECLNRFRGDGAGNPERVPLDQQAFRDWRKEMARLISAAQRCGIYLTIPVVHWRERKIFNSMFLISPEGNPVWTYDKTHPTPEELERGISPGKPSYYEWKGVRLGGLICFDSCFPENVEWLAGAGVDLVLFASLWPGGSQLGSWCKLYSLRMAVAYPAWSRILDLDGREVVGGGYRHETLRFGFGAPVYTATLNFDRLAFYGNHNQEHMVAIQEKYGSRVRIQFDQENCLWFLDSTDPDLSEREIQKEFGLLTAREYFSECRRKLQNSC